jgi:hypothetical protein
LAEAKPRPAGGEAAIELVLERGERLRIPSNAAGGVAGRAVGGMILFESFPKLEFRMNTNKQLLHRMLMVMPSGIAEFPGTGPLTPAGMVGKPSMPVAPVIPATPIVASGADSSTGERANGAPGFLPCSNSDGAGFSHMDTIPIEVQPSHMVRHPALVHTSRGNNGIPSIRASRGHVTSA